MATIVHTCGGECAALLDHWTAVVGSPAIQSTYKRSGNDAIRCNTTSATARIAKTFAGGNRRAIVRFSFYFPTLPAADQAALAKVAQFASVDDVVLAWDTDLDRIGVNSPTPGGAVYAPTTIVAGQWYTVDLDINTSANPWVVNWRLDGVAQTAYTCAVAASDIIGCAFGWNANATADVVFDDIAYSNTAADYPIPDGTVGTGLPETYTESTGYRDAIMDLLPVGYWRLGDTSGTVAEAIVGPSGTYEGTPTLGASGLQISDSNKAVTFSGDDNVNLGDPTWFDATNRWTVTMWVNSTADFNYRRLWGKEDFTGGQNGTAIFWQNSEWGVGRYLNGAAVEAKVASGAPTGTHLIAATYATDNKLHLYVDGVQVVESATTSTSMGNRTVPLRLGAAELSPTNFWQGTMDEVAIFARALTAGELLALYTAGTTAGGGDTTDGPRYPGTTATLANAGTSENAEAWVTPANIVSDNATEASITAATYDSPDLSQLLVASNFGFSLPTGATIKGITVEVDRRSIIAGSGRTSASSSPRARPSPPGRQQQGQRRVDVAQHLDRRHLRCEQRPVGHDVD